MVKFNQLEKSILRKISKIDIESNDMFSKFLNDQYFTSERNEVLMIKHDTKEVVLYVKPEVYEDDKKRPRAMKELWILISLIEYLIEKRYVLKVPIGNYKGIDLLFSNFGSSHDLRGNVLKLNKDGDFIDVTNPGVIYNSNKDIIFRGFLLNEYYSYISNNLSNLIISTTTLEDLVQHNFKYPEERKYKRQTIISWIGIVLSALIGFYGVYSNIQASNNSATYNEKVLEKVDVLIEKIKENNSEIINPDMIADSLMMQNDKMRKLKSEEVVPKINKGF